MMCNNQFCSDSSHINDIDNLFSFVKECISSVLLRISGKRKYKVLPGWNNYIVRSFMKKLRQHLLLWNQLGRLKYGSIFEGMKRSCKALNYCKINELKLRKEKLLSSFCHGNKKNWD